MWAWLPAPHERDASSHRAAKMLID
jgi:hypothetical protein